MVVEQQIKVWVEVLEILLLQVHHKVIMVEQVILGQLIKLEVEVVQQLQVLVGQDLLLLLVQVEMEQQHQFQEVQHLMLVEVVQVVVFLTEEVVQVEQVGVVMELDQQVVKQQEQLILVVAEEVVHTQLIHKYLVQLAVQESLL